MYKSDYIILNDVELVSPPLAHISVYNNDSRQLNTFPKHVHQTQRTPHACVGDSQRTFRTLTVTRRGTLANVVILDPDKP